MAGAVGLALVTAGTWGLVGWAWAAVLLGSILLGLYIVRELRTIIVR